MNANLKSIYCMKSLNIALAAVAALLASCGTPKGNNTQGPMNMSFLELAEARYSVRQYAKTPVEQEKIDCILEAAKLAPTAKNLQPQFIYVLKSAEAIAKVNEVSSCAYNAPVVFIVCYDKDTAWKNPLNGDRSSGEMDASIVGTHMMLEAASQGLGTCWVGWFDPAAVSKAFDIPDNLYPAFMLDCGYPADGSKPSPRHYASKEISDFVKEL